MEKISLDQEGRLCNAVWICYPGTMSLLSTPTSSTTVLATSKMSARKLCGISLLSFQAACRMGTRYMCCTLSKFAVVYQDCCRIFSRVSDSDGTRYLESSDTWSARILDTSFDYRVKWPRCRSSSSHQL